LGRFKGMALRGRKIVQTDPIVVQVRASENEEKGEGPFGRDSGLGMPIWKRFMKTV